MLPLEEKKNILLVRLDNMGDVIMSSAAFQEVREQTNGKITLLTSSMAAPIAEMLDMIDEVITCDLPWLKHDPPPKKPDAFIHTIVDQLKEKHFDACIIFSVYSQSILPTALLCWMAQIPYVAGYCRENPYHLLTHWVIEQEPDRMIKHQIQRDLDLVEQLGYDIAQKRLPTIKSSLSLNLKWPKLLGETEEYIVIHPGVSEKKREYPLEGWQRIIQLVLDQTNYKIVISGSDADLEMYEQLYDIDSSRMINLMGEMNIHELCSVIEQAEGMISVNTGPAHIAMCYGVKIVVLYAETNPQHAPWSIHSKALFFSIAPLLRSKNAVISTVNEKLYKDYKAPPTPQLVITTLLSLINKK